MLIMAILSNPLLISKGQNPNFFLLMCLLRALKDSVPPTNGLLKKIKFKGS